MCNKIVDSSKGKINRSQVTGNILNFRNFIKKSAFRVRKAIMFHVNKRIKKNCSEVEKAKKLQGDILNVIHHVFGQHNHCKNRGLSCSGKKTAKELDSCFKIM